MTDCDYFEIFDWRHWELTVNSLTLVGPFSVKVFGPFEALDSTGARVPLRSKRSKALLGALMVARGARLTRTRIQSLLWTGREKIQASASLRQELRTIRRAFGTKDVIVGKDGTVALNGRLVKTGPPEDLADHGEFLHGIDLPGEFGDWVAGQRARFADTANISTSQAPREPLLSAQT